MVKRILNSKAVQKLLTVNPPTKLSARRMMQALITKRNKPNVKIVAGRVNKTSNGFTKILSNPKTAATITAVV